MPEPPLTQSNTVRQEPEAWPARLIVLHGDEVSNHIALDRASVSIGRADKNDLVLNSDHVSRHHAVVTRCESQTQIEDLDSRNGVVVNGRRLQPGHACNLSHGDTIGIGDQVIVFIDASPEQTIRRLSTIHIDRNRVCAEVDGLLNRRPTGSSRGAVGATDHPEPASDR